MSEASSAPDDAADIRRTILILSVCGFASALATRFVDPMVGVIARDLAADPLNVALLSSAFALPYALIQPVLGPIGDAIGKERMIKFLMIALALTLLAASLTDDLSTLFLCRILSGAAGGGIIPMALATIGDRVAMIDRQVAIGRFLTATLSGGLLGGVAAGLLATLVTWRGVFAIAAAIALAAWLAVMFGFRHSKASGRFSFSVAASRYRRILGIPRALALMAFVFVEGVFVLGFPPYVAPLLESSGMGGATEAGLIIGGFAIGGIVYTLIVRWLLATLGLGLMLQMAGFIVAAGFGVLGPAWPWPVQVAAAFAMGLGFYMLHNSFQTQITEVAPDARASAVALHAFAFFCGQALGPVVFGLMLGSVGRMGAFAVCALGAACLGLVASRVLVGQPRAR